MAFHYALSPALAMPQVTCRNPVAWNRYPWWRPCGAAIPVGAFRCPACQAERPKQK